MPKSPMLVNICCNLAPIHYNHLSLKLDLQEAGGKKFGLYNQVNIGSLKKLRHKIFMAVKSVEKTEQLRTTKGSLKYHFLEFFT